MPSFLSCFSAALLLCLLPTTTVAHHFHYISITDTRWPENDPNDPSYDPDWLLSDTIGDAPLEEWVVFTGLDDDISIDDSTNGYFDATGDAAAQSIWDASLFDDITNSQHTAFWEIKFLDLDSQAGKTVEIGLTDLVYRVRWEESEQTLSTNVLPPSDDVLGLPRMTDFGDFPLRFQLYYHFSDYVFTLVAINDAEGTSETFSLQGSAQPFLHFFDDGVGGTDPDNLDIYAYILCESRCEVEVLDWDLLNCNTVSGVGGVDKVDVANCYPQSPAPPVFKAALSDGIEGIIIDEHSSGDVFDVDANNGNGGAIDSDVSYSIVSGNNDIDGDSNLPFAIDPNTGMLSINDPDDLDVEAGVTNFFLIVRATDDLDALTSEAFVIVALNDIDDKVGTTTTIISDNPDPSQVGEAVTVVFAVTSAGGTPTGAVTVNADSGESCSATVAQASCEMIFAAAGERGLTVSYAGDGNFAASNSPSEPHTVSDNIITSDDFE